MAHLIDPASLADAVNWLHGWKWTGNFTTLDLIAAGTNALNGGCRVRRSPRWVSCPGTCSQPDVRHP